MNWRVLAASVIVGLWTGALIASALGYGDKLLEGLSVALIGLLGGLAIAHGLSEARRLGSGLRVGDRVLLEGELERLLRDWYAADKLTVEQFDLLMGEVVAGCADWRTYAEAVAKAADIQYRAEVRAAARAGEIPDRAAKTYLKLPPGYFDGNLSAQEPEDKDGWAEVRRGDGTSYWIRSRP